jgi:hypothetical protein
MLNSTNSSSLNQTFSDERVATMGDWNETSFEVLPPSPYFKDDFDLGKKISKPKIRTKAPSQGIAKFFDNLEFT